MALSAFAAPIMEGKLAQWREFIREIGEGGSRHDAYVASRQAMGATRRVRGVAPGNGNARALLPSTDEEIHGFDLRQVATQPGQKMAFAGVACGFLSSSPIGWLRNGAAAKNWTS
ncbi:MAG: hypothetical protein LC797_14015 [Chloroflexi bacterium]|nr:hypothetical protein [Chloroflexota bacterium]